MSELRKAAQQALEALKNTVEHLPVHFDEHFEAIEALRTALAQPEQEPVAWWDGKESVVFMHDEIYTPNWTDYWTRPLYTHPPQRKPLTEDEIAEICMDCSLVTPSDIYFARAIEKAHGIGGEE